MIRDFINENLIEIKRMAFETGKEAIEICEGFESYLWIFNNGYIENYVETGAYPSSGTRLVSFRTGIYRSDEELKQNIDFQLEMLLDDLKELQEDGIYR